MLRDWWRIFRVARVKNQNLKKKHRKIVRRISHKRQIEVNNRQIYWSIWWHLMCFINILTFREFYELNVTWPHVRCIELRLLRHFKTTNSLFIKFYFLTDKIEFWWINEFWFFTNRLMEMTDPNRFQSVEENFWPFLVKNFKFLSYFFPF